MSQILKIVSPLNVIIISTLLLGLAWFGLAKPPVTGAQGIKSNLCEGASLSLSEGGGDSCQKGNTCTKKDDNGKCIETETESKLNNLIASIINIFSVIVGIIAVIMIIIGGLKFITSGGDSGKISSAKSTVIYAIIGLIIVALAQFIVRFVLSKL